MKLKMLVITIISAVTCLSLPILADANTVPWSTQEYTAYVHGEEYDGDGSNMGPFVTMTGPPLPITAADSYSFGSGGSMYWDLSSTITSSSMNIYLERTGVVEATASANFLGTYTADSSNPFFKFTYSLTENALESSHWIIINDLTDNTNLYNDGLSLSNDPVSIFVPTATGHEISVYFGIAKSVGMWCCTQTYDTAMTYNMSVVPEPISSTLFIIGGATLGFRRFRKRK